MNCNFGFRSSAVSMQLAGEMTWAHPIDLRVTIAALTDNGGLNTDSFVSLLAQEETDKAATMTDAVERRHFLFRRCFQRLFLAHMLDWQRPLSELRLVHRLDTRPICLDSPQLCLSFTSSGPVAVACAGTACKVGVDVEKIRAIENPAALARRFFTPSEAQTIAAEPPESQAIRFLQHWTAKEAGLKALGQGIVSGLNSFSLARTNGNYAIEKNDVIVDPQNWSLHYPDMVPQHIVAVVHKSEK